MSIAQKDMAQELRAIYGALLLTLAATEAAEVLQPELLRKGAELTGIKLDIRDSVFNNARQIGYFIENKAEEVVGKAGPWALPCQPLPVPEPVQWIEVETEDGDEFDVLPTKAGRYVLCDDGCRALVLLFTDDDSYQTFVDESIDTCDLDDGDDNVVFVYNLMQFSDHSQSGDVLRKRQKKAVFDHLKKLIEFEARAAETHKYGQSDG